MLVELEARAQCREDEYGASRFRPGGLGAEKSLLSHASGILCQYVAVGEDRDEETQRQPRPGPALSRAPGQTTKINWCNCNCDLC